jgi:arylsulfatase A-like enzyme
MTVDAATGADAPPGVAMTFLLIVLLAAATASGQERAVRQTSAVASRHPSFVVILADDLGYGDVEIHGASAQRTPTLLRLADEGIRLDTFYAAGTWCTPTRAALLTGSYPRRVGLDVGTEGRIAGMPGAQLGLHPSEATLPELLRGRGYATAVVGKWHLGEQPEHLPTRHGFDRWLGLAHPNDAGREGFLRWGRLRRDTGYRPLALLRDDRVIEQEPDQSLLTQRYTDEAIRFLGEQRDRPFFLYVAHSMPHKPAHASPAFRGRSRGGLYGDSIEEIDASTGRILDALDRLGLAERTLVLFTSDNGAGRGWGSNAPFSGWKKTTREGGMRVPFAARWPGRIPAGTRSDELVTVMDLLPTFARLAGAPLPDDRILDGRDVWPILAGEAEARSPHQHFLYWDGGRLEAVRDQRFKLQLVRSGAGGEEAASSSRAGSEEASAPRDAARRLAGPPALYDLLTDRAELHDVAALHPDVVERLSAVAVAARRELGDAATGERGTGARAPGVVREPRPLTPWVAVEPGPAGSGGTGPEG